MADEPSTDSEAAEARAANAFFAAYFADVAAGGPRPVEDYVARFPRHAELVRREFAGLAGERIAATAAEPARGAALAAEPAGRRLGPYALLRELGRGAQGVVHLARDLRLGRLVALKALSAAPGLFGPAAAERFRREAAVAAKLDHPGLCPVFEAGEADGVVYIAMRFVEGASLAHVLAERRGPAPDARAALAIVEAVARALHVAHEAGVVHRDVKPSNVLIDGEGRPVVVDFGLARDDDDAGATLTGTDEVFGTPAYMAPERFAGRRADRRADVWSLGVVLYELLAGRRPFAGPTRDRLRAAIEAADPPTSPDARGVSARDLDAVLRVALEKSPDRRYRTALDFAEDLRRLGAGEPVFARPPSAAVRLARTVRRHRVVAAATALVLVVSAAAFARTLRALEDTRAESARHAQTARRLGAALEDVDRLDDLRALRALVARADGLWPEGPALIAPSDAWIAEAERLLARADGHRATLAALGAAESADAGSAPRRDGYLREGLAEFAAAAARLPALLDDVRRRRAWSAEVVALTVDARRAAWDEAAREVAADPRFAGFALRPIPGLAPLGPDPRSGLEEFAFARTGEVPARDPESEEISLRESHAVVLVLVPGGAVELGADPHTHSRPAPAPHIDPFFDKRLDARRQRRTLRPFLIAKHETTQAQWLRIMGGNPSGYPVGTTPGGKVVTGLHPVEFVRPETARAAARRLGLRLPRDDEWERAHRAGASSIWPTGDDRATFARSLNLGDEGSAFAYPPGTSLEKGVADGFAAHAPVGSFPPNRFGLHDMAGNVGEPVEGAMAADGGALLPSFRERPGADVMVVVRGGSYLLDARWGRCISRREIEPTASSRDIGARFARDAEP